MAKAEIRMTEGPIAKQLVSFAIPLFLGFLFQQLYNTADALIVGNLLGNSALAAVTGTGTLIFLLVGFFGGISMGAGVVVSRFFGSREVEKMRAAIHTNIAFGMAAGVFLTVVGMLFTPQILQWMGTPQEVFDHPANLFVAGFIGMPRMNTFDAQLQRDPDGKYAVQLENAHVVLSDEKQARLAEKNVQPGRIVLGIRPEHIMLAGEGEQMIHGTVDVSEMMGSAVHLHLQACGRDTIIIVQTMSMQGATNSSFGIGQSIAFTFGGNVVHVFDPETGKNLEF